ncbi:MAG TPA: toll/interleukin-1 receptor domain-containing protein [Pyrinomonadaceae bacterium]|nr:toll/interleukin-1 receptor domain-containing protein [Pyrinomonadaceae bacterium]
MRFVEFLNLLESDKGFAEEIAKRRNELLGKVNNIDAVRELNKSILEGDWHLRSDIERIIEDAATDWIKRNQTLLKKPISSKTVTQLLKLIQQKVNTADKVTFLYHSVQEIESDRNLVYFLDLESIIAQAIRGHLFSAKKDHEEVNTITDQTLSRLKQSTELLSPSWPLLVLSENDLTGFLSRRVSRYITDLLIAKRTGWLVPSWTDAQEIVSAYSAALRSLDSISSTLFTPDAVEMARITDRWSLREQYAAFVFQSSLLSAPITKQDQVEIASIVNETVSATNERLVRQGLSTPDETDTAVDLAIQRSMSRVLGDLSTSYADIVWPAWVVNMAGFPEIAVNIILEAIVPAIISGSIGTYLGWLIGKHQTDLMKLRGSSVGKSVLDDFDEACKELLRYRYYLFEQTDLESAAKTAEKLGSTFLSLAKRVNENQPVLIDDLRSLATLFTNESMTLGSQHQSDEALVTIIKTRKDFVDQKEIMKIIRERAEEIVKQHIGARTGLYERHDSIISHLSKLVNKVDKRVGNRDRTIAIETANRLVTLNGPYILALSIRAFLREKLASHSDSSNESSASNQSKGPRVFLAHASEDKNVVRELYGRLKSSGFEPWLDEIDILPGQNWRIEVPKAIRESNIFIACFSRQSVKKHGYVQKEFRLALTTYAEKPAGSIFLIPLRLDECDLPELEIPEFGVKLADIQWVDYWKSDGFDALVKSIRRANFGYEHS